MKNRWVDTSHGMKDDKIYGMFDPSVDSDIMKENLQEWLCDNRLEVTECISIVLRNHERSYSEWFRYVDSCSGPDELALYCLLRKMGIHTAVFNKSYIWTTLVDHITCTDEEIIQLCGVNLVFLGPAHYGILGDIRRLSKNMGPLVNPKSSSSTPNPLSHRKKKPLVVMVAPLTKKGAVAVAVVMENHKILQMKENDHIPLVSCVVGTMELLHLVPVHVPYAVVFNQWIMYH